MQMAQKRQLGTLGTRKGNVYGGREFTNAGYQWLRKGLPAKTQRRKGRRKEKVQEAAQLI